MSEHGFGIVGCGMISEFHAQAIGAVTGARLVAAWLGQPFDAVITTV